MARINAKIRDPIDVTNAKQVTPDLGPDGYPTPRLDPAARHFQIGSQDAKVRDDPGVGKQVTPDLASSTQKRRK